eukprot:TRINITY_DN10053_c0_g1_i1.p1 TRINITY_DN10053_c0_g1~~TRINITY_DN10053_c0_g1_i1.p1  ORF type:complete len:138 (+),score=13.93 TRINITY_DN10053_c0_g1_i1:197-610(+)
MQETKLAPVPSEKEAVMEVTHHFFPLFLSFPKRSQRITSQGTEAPHPLPLPKMLSSASMRSCASKMRVADPVRTFALHDTFLWLAQLEMFSSQPSHLLTSFNSPLVFMRQSLFEDVPFLPAAASPSVTQKQADMISI